MLIYIVILILLGGGYAGWMGYRSHNPSNAIKQRMNGRNHWLKMHEIAKQTDHQKDKPDINN